MDCAEHVVVREDVVKAQILYGSPDPPNRSRISSKLGLRIDNTNMHGLQPFLRAGLEGARHAVRATVSALGEPPL